MSKQQDNIFEAIDDLTSVRGGQDGGPGIAELLRHGAEAGARVGSTAPIPVGPSQSRRFTKERGLRYEF